MRLHTQYEAAPEAAMRQDPGGQDGRCRHRGQGWSKSTNFQPVFQIQSWVDRPDVLGPRTVPAPRAQAPVATAMSATPPVVNTVPSRKQRYKRPALPETACPRRTRCPFRANPAVSITNPGRGQNGRGERIG